jgi:hypothetical protein
MPYKSRDRDQTDCSPWSSILGVRREANNTTLDYCYETVEEAKTQTEEEFLKDKTTFKCNRFY